MSDITSEFKEVKVFPGKILDVTEEGTYGIYEVIDLIGNFGFGFDTKAYRAVGSALKRAAESGRTAAKSAVTKEYMISSSEFLRQTRNTGTIVHDKFNRNELNVKFVYAGYVIPLIRFNTRVGKDGRVYTQVKRSSTQAALDHAFTAHVGGHNGIFERVGPSRTPIRELYGPSTPQMMQNSEVLDKVEEKVVETYKNRMDHEIMRLFYGWGD